MGEEIQVISTTTVQASTDLNTTLPPMELSPLDLNPLLRDPIQQGLLFHFPHSHTHTHHNLSIINHLKLSLSSTLTHFPPLAGRLTLLQHNNSASFFIDCNNAGALFLHAVAPNTTVSHILHSPFVPTVIYSLFPLNGVKNYQGTTNPLLAVQVTELHDGIFIAFTMNHSVVDGTSFWHFINSWSQISRASDRIEISNPPLLSRWFPREIARPIRIPFPNPPPNPNPNPSPFHLREQRMFHFTKSNITKLKSKANAESNTNTISSLQALLGHIWCSVVRNQGLEPEKEMKCILGIGVRDRLDPPLPENYFGNAVQLAGVATVKAGELIEGGGLRKAALELNKMVASNTKEKIQSRLDSFVKDPRLQSLGDVIGDALMISNSPRFDIYSNDFGWGKPVGVRSGGGNKNYGKVTLFAGAEEGSVDIEACLSKHILEAMGNDSVFMSAVGY